MPGPTRRHGCVVLSDAVNALVQTVDVETQPTAVSGGDQPWALPQLLIPRTGWLKLRYGQTSGFPYQLHLRRIRTSRRRSLWGPRLPVCFRSRDGGKSWQRVAGVPAEAPVNTIARDAQRQTVIYVGTKQSFYMSHDGGASWTRRGGNLPFGDFTSILINPRNADEIFVGNAYQTGEIGGGVFRSVNAADLGPHRS